MKLTIARHGETDYNAEGRYQGRMDIPLNQKGLEQAEQLALKLEGMSFDVIITSTQVRASKTAEIIASRLKLPLITSDLLVEISLGLYEGLTRAEAAERYPEIWAQNPMGTWNESVPGGESVRDVDERVSLALNQIRNDWAGKSVLVICHGFVARIVNRVLMNIPFEEMGDFVLGNCEYLEYTLKEE